jgi:hypothetical protein
LATEEHHGAQILDRGGEAQLGGQGGAEAGRLEPDPTDSLQGDDDKRQREDCTGRRQGDRHAVLEGQRRQLAQHRRRRRRRFEGDVDPGPGEKQEAGP